jgi:hypothetical protein
MKHPQIPYMSFTPYAIDCLNSAHSVLLRIKAPPAQPRIKKSSPIRERLFLLLLIAKSAAVTAASNNDKKNKQNN